MVQPRPSWFDETIDPKFQAPLEDESEEESTDDEESTHAREFRSRG